MEELFQLIQDIKDLIHRHSHDNTETDNLTEKSLKLSDNTTNNASSSKHGFLPKLSGSASQYLDGSGAFSAPTVPDTTFNATTTSTLFDDFVFGNNTASGGGTTSIGELCWITSGAGTGGAPYGTIDEIGVTGHPGVIYNTDSGTVNSGLALNTVGSVISPMNANSWTMIWGVVLDTSVTGQRHRWGMTSDPQNINGGANGIFFEYVDGTDSHVRGCCRSGSSNTYTSSGYTPVLNTWMQLKAVMNSAGTSIEFFVNGTSIGTITTGIPTADARFFAQAIKVNGTTNRHLLDYFYFTQTGLSR